MTRAAAIEVAQRGWHVFPCRAGDKRPAIDKWEQRACADPERVARHWPDGANIGLACGPSGLVVIDLDCHGQLPEDWQLPGVRDGRDVLAVLAERAGVTGWPCTYTVTTARAGWHLYFRALPGSEIRNSAGKIGPMIDVRAAGGYVVGAGSVIDGTTYACLDDSEPVPLPGWLAGLLDPPRPLARPALLLPAGPAYPKLRGVVEAVLAARPGERNNLLYWAARRAAEMIAAGQVTHGAAWDALALAGEHVGLGAAEVQATLRSALREAP